MAPTIAQPANPVRASADVFAPIAADLDEVERILARTLRSERPSVAELVQHVGRFRGKRLRPALLLLTAHACGAVTRAHYVLAAVVEMVHTATLVHDDVLDSASVRRHVPTVNARWGNQQSVLLGDYLFTKAFHLASTLDDVRGCRIVGEATNRVCEGELQQGAQCGNFDLTEAEYLDCINGKTADLTACCCRLGAVFAGANAATTEGLARYGQALGIAFQIADDLLDLIGEERTTGKSLGTDVAQQKVTLPLIRLLGKSPAAARVRDLLSSPGNHKRELLAPFLSQCDAIDYARRRAEQFAYDARLELACLPFSPWRAILEALPEQVVHRVA